MTKPRNPLLRQEDLPDKGGCGWSDHALEQNAEFRNLKDGQRWEAQSIRFCASRSDRTQQWRLASERFQASEFDFCSNGRLRIGEGAKSCSDNKHMFCSQDP